MSVSQGLRYCCPGVGCRYSPAVLQLSGQEPCPAPWSRCIVQVPAQGAAKFEPAELVAARFEAAWLKFVQAGSVLLYQSLSVAVLRRMQQVPQASVPWFVPEGVLAVEPGAAPTEELVFSPELLQPGGRQDPPIPFLRKWGSLA